MAEPSPIIIAVAGAGDTTEENLAALLNDFLGFGEEDADGFYTASDREVALVLPASKTHSNKNLDKVIDWSAKADLPYYVIADEATVEKVPAKAKKTLDEAEDVKEVPVGDVNTELLAALDELSEDGDEKYLLVLLGEEDPSEEILALLEAADDAGISIKDITAGLDDVKLTDDEDAAEPEPEPEPEPEKPRRRGRRAAAEQTVEEAPLEEPTPQEVAAAAKKDGEERKAAARAKVDAKLKNKAADLPHDKQTESSLDTGSVLVQVEDLTEALGVIGTAVDFLATTDRANALVNNADEINYRPLTLALNEVFNFFGALTTSTPSEAAESTEPHDPASPAAEEPPAAPRRSRGRPRADGTPAQPKDPDEPTITVFEDEDGTLTKAGRGRPPKGQKRTKITEAQAKEAGLL